MYLQWICAVILAASAVSGAMAQLQNSSGPPALSLPEITQTKDTCKCPEGLAATCDAASFIARALNTGSHCYCHSESSLDHICLPPEKDCPCTREFEPQCNRQRLRVAANSCIAHCHGHRLADVNHWNCKLLPESAREDFFSSWDAADVREFECKETCLEPSPLEPNSPLCDSAGALVAESACIAGCEGRDLALLSAENCAESFQPAAPANEGLPSAHHDCVSNCQDDQSGPVCDDKGARIASSQCAAACFGYRPSQVSTSTCTPFFRDSVLCDCQVPESEEERVCNSKGLVITGSACLARCLGYPVSEVNKENCGIQSASCICPLIHQPLCDAKGTTLAGNPCDADCKYSAEAQELMSEENCHNADLLHDNAACGCAGTEARPVCDVQGTEIAPSACVASCAKYRGYVLCSDMKPPPAVSSPPASGPASPVVAFLAPETGKEEPLSSFQKEVQTSRDPRNSGQSANSTDNINPGTIDGQQGNEGQDESGAVSARAGVIPSVMIVLIQVAISAFAVLELLPIR